MQEAGPGLDLDRHVEKEFREFEEPHFGPIFFEKKIRERTQAPLEEAAR